MSATETLSRYVDALRLTDRQWQAILSDLATDARCRPDREQRAAARQSFVRIVGLREPDGDAPRYMVRSRNLGGDGIAFLHGRRLAVDSSCVIELGGLNGEQVSVSGRIAHCRRVWEHVHEVGVTFDDVIEVERFVNAGGALSAELSKHLPH